ncbi:strawberry notch family protein [Sphingobium sp. AN558]|uniref:strawberry notch-like NTP hydrolase domain-containing protein n=1 Tax=Sphingobium sp. AN558 TaxID=3133442 RepID=UPI0030C063C5
MNMPLFAEPAGTQPAGSKTLALFAAAQAIAERLSHGGIVDRRLLGALLRRHVGGSDASGDWTMREAYDALEIAQVLRAQDPQSGLVQWDDPAAAFAAREELSALLPTQHYRSERQIALQQFSTPLGLAWAVACAADIHARDLILEPSAGTGMLAVHALARGAELLLNERDPDRAALLTLALGQPVSCHDAEFIDDLIKDRRRPSLVLINPPFSRSESRGIDRHAGARHLESALHRLGHEGRCVAIMPPSFARDESGAHGYEMVARTVLPRWELAIAGKPYAKHGTSVSVRILVYDKGWGGPTTRHAATGLAEMSALLETVPPRLDGSPSLPPEPAVAPAAVNPARMPERKRLRLFPGLAGARPAAPLPAVAATTDEPALLCYETLAEPPAAGDAIGIYVPWRLSRMRFEPARPHPDCLVESMAMASILPPVPAYRPMLPDRTVATLSDAQLETVVFAGQAFDRDLPGRFRPNDAATLLHPDSEGAVYRAGFMVGDGTGVGKGRQIAACIMDQWSRGQHKAVWISKSASLLEDARRDWAAIGGLGIDVQPLDTVPLGKPIAMDSAILFLTFATLRSQRDDSQSRLQQILAWLGADFDGLIVFDEAHEMANAAGTTTKFGGQKGSEQGLAGVRLQNLLPRARILYNSATGATDPANLCYAARLGLWGSAAFETREAFMAAIGDGGIAAMEIVARDLKAMGFYTARALTFQGVDYEPLEHVLAPEQIETYDAYADAWALIHRDLDKALAATAIVDGMTGKSLNAQAKGAALSRFESAKQRFFAQLLISMKLPTVIQAIEADIAQGRHPVVQLVTTSEAMLDRHLAGLSAQDRADLDIELSPRELMIQYLTAAFPTRQMRIFKDPGGDLRSEPMQDEAGNAVHCAKAVRARDDLVEQLCAMPPIPSALDALVAHFGADRLAEVTGRTRRIVIDGAGRQRLDRRTARSNIAEAQAFMDGAKSVLIFSDAGGTGRSYHADRGCASADRRRVHYLLEPGWRAAAAIQGLGRTNRTNQMTAPIFRPVTTDCRGERRFISTIARRLDSLGALTRGQRQTGGQNLFDPMDNLESDHARDALQQWYLLLYRGKLKSVTLGRFVEMTGLKLVSDDGGALLDDLPPIQRWLNRLLALRIAMQNAIFEEYMALIQARIDAARERGTLDVGVETILVEQIVPVDQQRLRRDPDTGAETWLQRLELHRRRRPADLGNLLEQWGSSRRIAFLRNARSGRVALRLPSWSILDNDGEEIEVWELARPSGSERMRASRLSESAWEPVAQEAFWDAWTAEAKEIAERIDVETISIATGLLLPVWNRLPQDDLRVWRIADGQGQSVLGRIISPAGLAKIANGFGVDMKVALSPAELVLAARGADGVAIPAMEGARLHRVHVNDEARLEIKSFPVPKLARLKALGCFTEIIRFRTRLFVPTNRAAEILGAIEKALSDGSGLAA